MSARLIPSQPHGAPEIIVSPGKEKFVGRNEMAKADKRLSRKQIRVKLDALTYALTLTPLGVNGVDLCVPGRDNVKLRRNVAYSLQHGDRFSLLNNDYRYTVHVTKAAPTTVDIEEQERVKATTATEKASTSTSTSTTTATKTNKKTRMLDVNTPDSKKLRAASAEDEKEGKEEQKVDEKPVCEFGQTCYRKNRDHWANFRHTDVVTSKKRHEKDKNEDDDSSSNPLAKGVASKKQKISKSGVLDPTTIADAVAEGADLVSAVSLGDSDKAHKKEANDNKEESTTTTTTTTDAKVVHKMPAAPADPQEVLKTSVEKARLRAPQQGDHTLAFPAFGTAKRLGFPSERAAPIIAKCVKKFLKDHVDDPHMRVVLVVRPESPLIKALRVYMADYESDERFVVDSTFDIAHINARGTPCRYIANEASWRLKPGAYAGTTNKQVFDIAGSQFADETRRLYPLPGEAGNVYPVRVPATSDLGRVEGVDYVLHVVSPTVDQKSSDAVTEDEAAKLIEKCYVEMFATFRRLFDN